MQHPARSNDFQKIADNLADKDEKDGYMYPPRDLNVTWRVVDPSNWRQFSLPVGQFPGISNDSVAPWLRARTTGR